MSRSQKLLLIVLVFIFISCNRPKVEPKTIPDQPTADQGDNGSSGTNPTVADPPTQEVSAGQAGNLIPILPAGTDIMIFEIQMVDMLNGWAIGGAEPESEDILRTEDGGYTWQDVTPPQPLITGYGDFTTTNLGSWDMDHAWVNYTGSDLIWSTSDGGASWSSVQASYTTHPDGIITVLDQDHIWVFQFLDFGMHKVYTSLMQTADGGGTWNLLLDPYLDEEIQSFYKTGAVFVTPQHGWLTRNFDGVSPDIFLTKTQDGGITWEHQSVLEPPSLPGFLIPEPVDYMIHFWFFQMWDFLDCPVFTIRMVK